MHGSPGNLSKNDSLLELVVPMLSSDALRELIHELTQVVLSSLPSLDVLIFLLTITSYYLFIYSFI